MAGEWRLNRGLSLLLVLAGAVVVVDQVSKELVVRLLSARAYASLELVGDWLTLTFVTNTGGAFGVLPQQTWLFVFSAALIVPAIIYAGGTPTADAWPIRLSLGLMLGGTLGNLLDRLRLGYVVDFVDIGLGTARWPSFNAADSAFVVGTFLVVFYVISCPQIHTAREQPMYDGAQGT